MSLKPRPIQPVPDETARVARAAFPKGNVYLTLQLSTGRALRGGMRFNDLAVADDLNVLQGIVGIPFHDQRDLCSGLGLNSRSWR